MATGSQLENPEGLKKETGLREEKQVVRATGVIALGTFVSRITGFLRDMFLAKLFGASIVADAFYVAYRIPNLLRELFAEGSMSAAFIPVFTDYHTKKTKEETRDLARASFSTLLALLIIVVGIGILLAPQIVYLIAPGWASTPGKFSLTVSLTQIMFPYLMLISLSALVMGMLNVFRHFGVPALSQAVFNIIMIVTILFIAPFYSEPIMAAALGVTFGGFVQLLYQLPTLARAGMIPHLRALLRPFWPIHPGVRRMGILILPTMIGLSVAQVNIFVNTLLASYLPEGSVSYLYYGMRLIHFPLGIFGVALATALLPTLSSQAAQGAFEEMCTTISFGLRLIFFITIPAMVGLIFLRVPIVHLLFQHGAFGEEATFQTAKAVLFYALGLWAFAGVRVVVPAFYSMQDTRTPVKIAILAMVSNIILNLLLMGPLQHGGLALAASLSSMLNLTLLLWMLRGRVGRIDGQRILFSLSKVVLASVAVAFPCLWVSNLVIWGRSGDWSSKILLLTMGMGLSLFGYVLFHSILKTEEQTFLFKLIKEKFSK